MANLFRHPNSFWRSLWSALRHLRRLARSFSFLFFVGWEETLPFVALFVASGGQLRMSRAMVRNT
jgi:hypothetical protein